jgi:hypothetical protein
MPQLPKLPPKQDLMKYFQGHSALVKLLALVLLVMRDVAVAGAATGAPVAVYYAVRHWVA